MSKKENEEYFKMNKSASDRLNDLAKFGAGFDWITPLSDILRGFNTIEFEGDPHSCKVVEKQLKAEGVKCRTQFTGDSWRVISKR